MNSWGRTSIASLFISVIAVSASTVNSSMDRKKSYVKSPGEASTINSSIDRKKSCIKPPAEDYSYLTASVGTKVVLSCPPNPSDCVILATWGIDLGGKFNCSIAYLLEKNETKNTCGDKGLTWFSRPDQDISLQIDPVAVSHEGNYSCQIVMLNGNFHLFYRLQVLVTPVVTLYERNRIAVCEAVGKPAARISWTPEGVCVTTEQKHWYNGIVKTQSICQLEGNNVATVSCSVFHSTGNTTKSIQLNQSISGNSTASLLIIGVVKFCLLLVVLIMVGFMYYQRKSACRT